MLIEVGHVISARLTKYGNVEQINDIFLTFRNFQNNNLIWTACLCIPFLYVRTCIHFRLIVNLNFVFFLFLCELYLHDIIMYCVQRINRLCDTIIRKYP